jgi:ubiquinone/menaquinone biosynthesis C-methylase UbiE
MNFGRQLLNGHRLQMERNIDQQRQSDLQPYLDTSRPLKILDLANGQVRPQYLILKAAGHKVVGIDLINRPASTWADRAYTVARQMFAWKMGVRRDRSALQTLVGGDVRYLPFPDDYFELITSVAAFEHFLDVPRVVAEMARVLRPGGLVWVGIHPFTAISGGHNVTATEFPLRHLPAGIDAWDHLRQRKLPFHVPLNEWRIAQYVDAFAQSLEILKHYCVRREGEELLTPEIEAELSAYSRDELTCLGYIIVARKQSQRDENA